MTTGFYRCIDISISLEDWMKLNFNRVSTSLVQLLLDKAMNEGTDSYELLERLDRERPEEPEEPEDPEMDEPCLDDFENEEDYSAAMDEFDEAMEEHERAVAEYEEAYAEWEDWSEDSDLAGFPAAWGTMWTCEDTPATVEALIEAGFVVYRTSGFMEDVGDILFGVDGGGYSFYGAHWLPLRALLVVELARGKYSALDENSEEFRTIIEHFVDRMEREGERRDEAFRRFGLQDWKVGE